MEAPVLGAHRPGLATTAVRNQQKQIKPWCCYPAKLSPCSKCFARTRQQGTCVRALRCPKAFLCNRKAVARDGSRRREPSRHARWPALAGLMPARTMCGQNLLEEDRHASVSRNTVLFPRVGCRIAVGLDGSRCLVRASRARRQDRQDRQDRAVARCHERRRENRHAAWWFPGGERAGRPDHQRRGRIPPWHPALGHSSIALHRRPCGGAHHAGDHRDARAGVARCHLQHPPRPPVRQGARPRGTGDQQRRHLRADDQPRARALRRPQLRDPRRGPVPDEPARRCRDARHPARGHDRHAQALRREQPGNQPPGHQRACRRAHAA